MGRNTKVRPLTARREEWLECYYKTRDWPIPQTADILREVVNALMFRFRSLDPSGAREIEILLQQMAAREWHFHHYRERYAEDQNFEQRTRDLMISEIHQIAERRTITHPAHHRSTLCRQRDVFGWFTTNNPFPWNDISQRKNWIRTHSQALLESIGVFLCTCKYPTKIKSEYVVGANTHSIISCHSQGQLNAFILGALHNIAPSHVQNLLKPSRAPR